MLKFCFSNSSLDFWSFISKIFFDAGLAILKYSITIITNKDITIIAHIALEYLNGA